MKRWSRCLSFAAMLVMSASAVAQGAAFPNRPIKIIVYVTPGALVDTTTRAVAERMAESLKQPVIVENMPGASGLLGIRYVKSQPADGYTLLAGTGTVPIGPILNAEPGYELKDFTAVGAMNQGALVMVGSPNQPVKTLQEFIALAKQKPGEVTFASGGVGTTTYLAASLFMHQAGIKLLHVPYKGTAAAMPDVLGGRVNMMFDAESSEGPQVREGKLRAFGVSSPKRSKGLPDVPTIAEQGLPNYSFTIYNGLLVRTGTPKEVVQRLASALQAALANEGVRERMRKDGTEPWPLSPDEFNAYMRQDAERIGKLASDIGMPKQ